MHSSLNIFLRLFDFENRAGHAKFGAEVDNKLTYKLRVDCCLWVIGCSHGGDLKVWLYPTNVTDNLYLTPGYLACMEKGKFSLH
jgi:hypothetical protein